MFGRALYEISRKEILQHLRTKRLLIIGGLLMASLAFLTLYIAPRFFDQFDTTAAAENMVLLFYFSAFFIGGYAFTQLLAIVLTADAVCSEWSNRSIFLVLSKPVSRAAFVLGKFLGSFITIAVTIVALFGLDYILLQGALAGSPTGDEVVGFLAALGILVLGAAAYAAWSLFVSTLSRSTVMSLLIMLGLWIIVFPLVGQIGLFTTFGDPDFNGDFDDPQVDWSRYLNPGANMAVAGRLLVPDEADRAALDFLSTAPASTGGAIAALLIHTVGMVGLALLVVQRRNFE